MKHLLPILSLLTICFFSSDIFAQEDGPPNPEPGKCYGKSQPLITEAYTEKEDMIAIYNGPKSDKIEIHKFTLITQAPQNVGTEKVTEAKTQDFNMVINPQEVEDENLIEYKKIKHFVKEEAIEAQWVEVLCEKQATEKVIIEVKEKLKAEGFFEGDIDGIQNLRFKNRLKTYQKAKDLPIGNLNIETVKHLQISY